MHISQSHRERTCSYNFTKENVAREKKHLFPYSSKEELNLILNFYLSLKLIGNLYIHFNVIPALLHVSPLLPFFFLISVRKVISHFLTSCFKIFPFFCLFVSFMRLEETKGFWAQYCTSREEKNDLTFPLLTTSSGPEDFASTRNCSPGRSAYIQHAV